MLFEWILLTKRVITTLRTLIARVVTDLHNAEDIIRDFECAADTIVHHFAKGAKQRNPLVCIEWTWIVIMGVWWLTDNDGRSQSIRIVETSCHWKPHFPDTLFWKRLFILKPHGPNTLGYIIVVVLWFAFKRRKWFLCWEAGLESLSRPQLTSSRHAPCLLSAKVYSKIDPNQQILATTIRDGFAVRRNIRFFQLYWCKCEGTIRFNRCNFPHIVMAGKCARTQTGDYSPLGDLWSQGPKIWQHKVSKPLHFGLYYGSPLNKHNRPWSKEETPWSGKD